MRCFIERNIENVVSVFVSFVLAVVFLQESPLHPWRSGQIGIDSSVFKTVALMMEKGYMPYRDSFDHKGPFLFLLNYFGNVISYYRGIWLIEVVFLVTTIFFIYKLARLVCGKFSSATVSMISLSLLFRYFDGGNYTEEYAMPFIAMAIYIFADYILNKHISKIRVVISGIGLGAVLLLRANMIAVWAVFCIFIFIRMIIQKEFIELRDCIVCFALGVAIFVAPIMIWLLINNDISSFWNDYIVFNIIYSSAENGVAMFSAKWSSFFNFANTSVCIMAFGSLIFHIKRGDKTICVFNIIYLVYMGVTIWLMVLSGLRFTHYGMIIIPAISYPLGLLFSDIESLKEENVKRTLLMIVTIYSWTTFILPQWLELIGSIPRLYETKSEKEIDKEPYFRDIIDLVQLNTNEDDTISVYGNWNSIYVLSKRKHATRYSYQFPISQVWPQIMEDYMAQLQEELPAVIVIQKGNYDENIKTFLKKNNYNLLWKSEEDEHEQSQMVFIKN